MTQPIRAYRRANTNLQTEACKNGAAIAIKKEPTARHDLLRGQSADLSTPKSNNAHSIVVSSSNDRLANEVDESCHAIHGLGCKRSASEPPMSHLPPRKRLYSLEAP